MPHIEKETYRDIGLLKKHAYSVLGVYEVADNFTG
jgi:hypothetical protein